jgi:hypothetical protein
MPTTTAKKVAPVKPADGAPAPVAGDGAPNGSPSPNLIGKPANANIDPALFGDVMRGAAALFVAADPAVDPAVAGASDVTDELDKGGPALGSFVKSVGLAVAEAQAQLDKTLVDTAKALSETQIEVAAVFEQVLDDTGAMQQGNVHMQKMPLVNYLMPTAYQWSRVYLEADMNVAEFNAKNGLNIQSKSAFAQASGGFKAGMLGVSGGASFAAGGSISSTSVGTTASTDTATGRLHLEATLEPRHDIQLPTPFILQKGPTISVSAGAVTPVGGKDKDGKDIVVGRMAEILVNSQKTDGTGNPNLLSITVTPGGLDVSTEPAANTPGADGKLKIKIIRQGALYQDGTTVDVLVRVRLGLINQTIAIRL